MGFKRDKVYKLIWDEGEELGPANGEPGLEVRVRPTSLRNYLTAERMLAGELPEEFETAAEALDWMFGLFAERLVSWTLEDEHGEPVSSTYDGVLSADRELVMLVIRAWLTALKTVSRPLVAPLPSGGPSAGVSIPMETLSESPES